MKKIFWIIYILFISLNVMSNLMEMISPVSHRILFYQNLIAFDSLNLVGYVIEYFAAMLNVFFLIIVISGLTKSRLDYPLFWKTIFILTISLNLAGNLYLKTTLKSYYYENQLIFYAAIFQLIVFFLPAVIIAYKKIFSKNQF